MSQQMVNGSHYNGSVTITNRMSDRYAVVGEPFHGKHALTDKQRQARHKRNVINRILRKQANVLSIKDGDKFYVR